MKNQSENYHIREQGGLLQRNLSRIKYILITLVAGILVGLQIYSPNKRIIEAIVGFILIFVFWRISTLAALWLLLIAYPFPFGISWGNSNFIFVVLITIMVLIKVSSGQEKFHLDRTLLLPVILLLFAYALSFQNVPFGTRGMQICLVNTANFISVTIFTFLLINWIDNVDKLKKTVNILVITAVLVIAFNILELLFPGRTLIPYWLRTHHTARLVMKGLRVKGPWNDFELNAEFFALNSFIIFFLLIRTRRLVTKSFLAVLLITDILMMFATVTRGAFFSLILGVFYLMYISRKDLNIVRFFYIIGGLVLIFFVLETFVAEYTTSGSLFERVVNTTFERGFIPDTRTRPWIGAIERGMENPIFGKGPGWDFASGFDKGHWPHNLYLFYFNSIGLVGLVAFLFLMYRIFKTTIPGIKSSLASSPFPEAFMKILHVLIIIFLFDQIKIEYLRNSIYTFFIWTLFGLVVITRNIIEKGEYKRDNLSAG